MWSVLPRNLAPLLLFFQKSVSVALPRGACLRTGYWWRDRKIEKDWRLAETNSDRRNTTPLLYHHYPIFDTRHDSATVLFIITGRVPRTKGRSGKTCPHQGDHHVGELAPEEQLGLRNHARQWLQVGHAARQADGRGTCSIYLFCFLSLTYTSGVLLALLFLWRQEKSPAVGIC